MPPALDRQLPCSKTHQKLDNNPSRRLQEFTGLLAATHPHTNTTGGWGFSLEKDQFHEFGALSILLTTLLLSHLAALCADNIFVFLLHTREGSCVLYEGGGR
jgi:hypothetical protein